jgi:ABC-type ATPase with predicted acetyltransferase domain
MRIGIYRPLKSNGADHRRFDPERMFSHIDWGVLRDKVRGRPFLMEAKRVRRHYKERVETFIQAFFARRSKMWVPSGEMREPLHRCQSLGTTQWPRDLHWASQ